MMLLRIWRLTITTQCSTSNSCNEENRSISRAPDSTIQCAETVTRLPLCHSIQCRCSNYSILLFQRHPWRLLDPIWDVQRTTGSCVSIQGHRGSRINIIDIQSDQRNICLQYWFSQCSSTRDIPTSQHSIPRGWYRSRWKIRLVHTRIRCTTLSRRANSEHASAAFLQVSIAKACEIGYGKYRIYIRRVCSSNVWIR